MGFATRARLPLTNTEAMCFWPVEYRSDRCQEDRISCVALFGGIGLALGVFANSASAQDTRPQQAPVRAAKLGVPSAVPDPAPIADDGVRPAGLRSRLQAIPIGSTPSAGTPATGTTIYGAPIPGSVVAPGGQPTPTSDGTVVPAPRPVTGGAPNVTEMRNSDGSILYPPGTLGGVVVPSVAPGGSFAPGSCLEAPLYGTPIPGIGAASALAIAIGGGLPANT